MIARALKLSTPRLVLQQIATAAVVFLLFLMWLRTPDSSWVYVLCTLIVSVALAVAFGVGETRVFCKLTGTTPARSTYVRGTILLLAALALWMGWDALISHVADKYDALWAGYLNSRFPHGLRPAFSYAHITAFLYWFWLLLDWGGAGLLTATIFPLIATPQPAPAIGRTLRSFGWWITFVLGVEFLYWLNGVITGWTPGHGLGVESLSLLLRLAAVVVIDAVGAVFLLALLATFSEP